MIPPVGEPIIPRLRAGTANFDWTFGGQYRPIFVDSGTTALRLAIETAREFAGRAGPIWVPAYGCPDIVTACATAGCEAILYDVEEESPFFATGQVALSGTIAVVAAHFLGLRHPAADIQIAARSAGALIIEDSAQRFPMAGCEPYGDLVVLSFGRGKPVSLLEGGCLLVAPSLFDHASHAFLAYRRGDTNRLSAMKRMLHDIALQPQVYDFVHRLPGLHVGRVDYSAAPKPLIVGPRLVGLASRAANGFRSETTWQERQQRTLLLVAERFPELRPLSHCSVEPPERLLRVPLLAMDGAAAAIRKARALGIGATHLYGSALPDIERAPVELVGDCRRARVFASHLVTFPVMPATGKAHPRTR